MKQHVNKKLNFYSLFFVVIIVLFFISCKENKQSETKKEHISKEVQNNKNKSKYEKVFKFENNKNAIKLEVNFKSDSEVEFLLVSHNKDEKNQCQINGKATLKTGDVEFDDDSEGNAYAVDEYIYKTKKFWLFFRFDSDTKSLVKIFKSEGEIEDTNGCSFQNDSILKLEK